MSLDNPLFLTVLFGIFHILGGLAFGRGIRAKMKAKKTGGHLLAWGAIMGITPILFDWFFLIRVGKITYGLTGPVLFFATVIGGIFLNGELTRNNEKSISAMLMGGTSLLLGFMLTPLPAATGANARKPRNCRLPVRRADSDLLHWGRPQFCMERFQRDPQATHL